MHILKATDQRRLNDEYRRLVSGLASRGGQREGESLADSMLANPALPEDILREAVPGNIRRAEHFISFLRKV